MIPIALPSIPLPTWTAIAAWWHGHAAWPFERVGSSFGAEEMQSVNSLMVMALVPVLTLWAYPRLGRLVTPLRRMSTGFFCAAASYVIVAWLQRRIEAGETLSVAWQLAPYWVLTVGEVLLSTTGLEFAFAEAAGLDGLP